MANQKDKILLIFDNTKNSWIKSICTAVKLYIIFYTILADYAKDIFVYIDYCPNDNKLTELEKIIVYQLNNFYKFI